MELTKDNIIKYLNNENSNKFELANNIRKEYVGDNIHLRGLIEFSNICKNTCYYCGLRCENSNVTRYRLSEDEIFHYAKIGKQMGLNTIVLQSGEDSYFNIDRLCKIVEKIKKLDVAITLSIGEKTYSEYKKLKEAGADRYLLRIETTDKELYKKLHPKMSLEKRKECLYNIKTLGFETGTGSLVGLPEQTIDSLAEDILFYKELDADMIGIGPFIPHPDTPLGEYKANLNESFNLALRMMAVTRIVLKDINIPATTAMETINPNGRILALNAGANVIMPNITGDEYKKNYSIYPDKISTSIKDITNIVNKIGRNISTCKGFRIKK